MHIDYNIESVVYPPGPMTHLQECTRRRGRTVREITICTYFNLRGPQLDKNAQEDGDLSEGPLRL